MCIISWLATADYLYIYLQTTKPREKASLIGDFVNYFVETIISRQKLLGRLRQGCYEKCKGKSTRLKISNRKFVTSEKQPLTF